MYYPADTYQRTFTVITRVNVTQCTDETIIRGVKGPKVIAALPPPVQPTPLLLFFYSEQGVMLLIKDIFFHPYSIKNFGPSTVHTSYIGSF